MKTVRQRILAGLGATAFALTAVALGPSEALAASPYDRPNAMTCVFNTVIVDAPTNVPVTGPVLWQFEVQSFNVATNQWESNYWSPQHTNTADQVYITAGPWADPDGIPTYSASAAIPVGTGPIQIRVYNHFWRAEQGQWVYVDAGFFSTIDGTSTGASTCVLDAGPIVV